MTHPDTDVLAEFRAGLITGRRGARITAHLAGCDRCAALDDQLAGVSVLLASVPAPPVPDRVAQRLDTVLAAEVARRDDAERARGDSASESPAPRRPRGNRGFRPLALRVLAPAAAVVLLAAGGYGLSRAGLGSSSSSSAITAGGAAKSVSSAKAPAGSRNAAAEPAQGPEARSQGLTGGIKVTISHHNFTHANLAQQVKAALLVPSSASTIASAQLSTCVTQLVDGHRLQRVESIHYEGAAATLIVARTGQDDTAWIAGPGCHVLAKTALLPGISGP
jgi:hypothetical protein